MHPKASKKIDGYLIQLIDDSKIKQGSLDIIPIFELVTKIDDIVYKSKSEWIEKGEIRTFIFASINTKIYSKHTFHNVNGRLSELLESGQLNEIVEEIMKEIEAIPIVYDVYLKLPNFILANLNSLSVVKDFNLIKIADDFISPLVPIQSILGSSTRVAMKKNEVYFHLKTKGLINNNKNCKAIQKVLNKIKLLIDIGFGLDVIIIADSRIILNLLGINQNQQAEFICVTENQSPPIGQSLILSDPLSSVIHKLKFKDEFYVIDEESISLDRTKKYTELKLEKLDIYLSLLRIAFNNLDKLKNIQNAIEWSFESRFSNNTTFSFILLCLAFESILGEDIPETNSISFTIADRCAYLLSKNQLHRKDIRKTFRDLYELRSKFVHGKKTNLTDDDSKLYYWGRDLLDIIIRKELDVIY